MAKIKDKERILKAEREKQTENTFEEILAENFPNLMDTDNKI